MIRSKDGKSRLPKPLSHVYAKLKRKGIDWRNFFGASNYFRTEEANMINTTTNEYIYDDRLAFKEFVDYCYRFYENLTYQGPVMGFTIRDMLLAYNHNLIGRLFADSCAEISYISTQAGGTDWDMYTYFHKGNVNKCNFSIDQVPDKSHVCETLDDFYFTIDFAVDEYFSKDEYRSSRVILFENNVSDLI